MAPIKLEDNFREKLEERELQPSPDAWSKLEARLPAAENTGKNKFFWYAIAASFVGIVIVGSFLFNSNSNAVMDNEIVLDESKTEVQGPVKNNNDFMEPEILEENENQVTPIQIASKESQKLVVAQKEEIKQQLAPRINQKERVQNTTEAVAQLSNKQEETQAKTTVDGTDELIKKEGIIDSKINEVIAQVQALEKENTAITAKEIEVLLAQAQREIATQRILNETTIDAAALLDDVESDLERSFRDKVFDALGDGYSKIRTAVVARKN